jgi:ABC-2 type transport system ATP-binding protein
LAARGLELRVDGREVLVELRDDRPYDLVRDIVAELGLPLVRIEQRRNTLEDLFRDRPELVPPAAATAPAATGTDGEARG